MESQTCSHASFQLIHFNWLDSEHLVVYLLDVSGHGLRAALPSLSVINLLRSRGLTKVNYYRPSEVLQGLNQTFQMTERNDKYFTIWYGVYNCKTRQLVYSSAGHPPAIWFSPEPEPEFGLIEQRLKTTGFPIGMFSDAEYVDDYCQISPDSILYIFSDGIYEIDRPKELVWGINEFIELLKKYHQVPENNLDSLVQHIKTLSDKENFDDDLSLMKITFH